jgi:hypothetical protein
VLLVGGDILARGRLESAASSAGMELKPVLPNRLVDELHAVTPSVVVLDLDAGGTRLVEEVSAAREQGVLPTRVVGFFSHVDEALGDAARAAGIQAFPRGRFWRECARLLAVPET